MGGCNILNIDYIAESSSSDNTCGWIAGANDGSSYHRNVLYQSKVKTCLEKNAE